MTLQNMIPIGASDAPARNGDFPRYDREPAHGLLNRIWYQERLMSGFDSALRQVLPDALLPDETGRTGWFHLTPEAPRPGRGLVVRAWLDSPAGLCELELSLTPARRIAQALLGLPPQEAAAHDLPSPFEEGALLFALEEFWGRLRDALPELNALAPLRVVAFGCESASLPPVAPAEGFALRGEIRLASAPLSVLLRVPSGVVPLLEAEIRPHVSAWEVAWLAGVSAAGRWLDAPAGLSLGSFVLTPAEWSALAAGDAFVLNRPGDPPAECPAHVGVEIAPGQRLTLPARIDSSGAAARLFPCGPVGLEGGAPPDGEITLTFETAPAGLSLGVACAADPSVGITLGVLADLRVRAVSADEAVGSGRLILLDGEPAVELLAWRGHAPSL